MKIYLPFLLLAYFLIGNKIEPNLETSELPPITYQTAFSETDTTESADGKPDGIPVLSDSSSYENLRDYLIELNNYLNNNRDQSESIFPKFVELCPIYYDMYREKRIARSNKFHQIIEGLPNTNSVNYTFLNSLIGNEETNQMTYSKPLSAVFQGITEKPSLFQTDPDSPAETQFLDSIKDHPDTRIDQPSTLQTTISFHFSREKDSVFVFTTEGRYKTSVQSFNYKTGECGSYFYYELDAIQEKYDTEQILLASSMNLELEFVKNDSIDEVLFEAFPEICKDCPSSERFQKVFARLKGYENFYFTYTQEPGEELDDTYMPQRSLIYYDGDLLHTVWSTNIDLFGCSCL